MAEGMIGGILGDEDEKEELEAPGSLAGAEAFASAVAARLSAADPDVARKTASFLEDQSRLLITQNRHLEEEHPLRLSQLQGQLREAMKEPRHEDLDVRGLGIKRFLSAGEFFPGLLKRVGTMRFGHKREHRGRHCEFVQRPPHPPPGERFRRVGGVGRRAQTTVFIFLAASAGAGIISTWGHETRPVIS
jgi:hypothetical protein